MSTQSPPAELPDPARIEHPREFAQGLTLLRERAGLSIPQVATAAGLATDRVGGYFSGRALPAAGPLTDLLAACGLTDPVATGQWQEALERARQASGPAVAEPEHPNPPDDPRTRRLVRVHFPAGTRSRSAVTQLGYAVSPEFVLTAAAPGVGWIELLDPVGPLSPSDHSAEVVWSAGDIGLLRVEGQPWRDEPDRPTLVAEPPEPGESGVLLTERGAVPVLLYTGESADRYRIELPDESSFPWVSGQAGAPILDGSGGVRAVLIGIATGSPDWLVAAPITAAAAAAALSRLTSPSEVTAPDDYVEWQSDLPVDADGDLLRRHALARAIMERLRRRTGSDPSFLMLLDGRWGSGKTSVLRMLDALLTDHGWLIIHYDAWRQARIGASWWTLLSTVRRAVFAGTPWHRRPFLRIRELWHVRLARTPALLALCLVSALALGLFLLLRPERFDLSSIGTGLQSAAATLTAAGTLWAGLVVSSRFLLWGSARSARFFEETTENPLRQVAEHIGWLTHQLRRPLLVIIDDLDRCRGSHVVELLEGVQTLLRDPPQPAAGAPPHPVSVIVAADAGWLHRAFESEYHEAGGTVAEPGKPLGHLFCDKIFQLVVPMPNFAAAGQVAFFGALLGLAGPAPASAGALAQARQRLSTSGSEAEVLDILSRSEPPVREQVAADAVAALHRREVTHTTEHALTRFAPLLPPNPRTMKRFVNDYTMARTVRTLEGDPVPVAALAQWTILRTRWPALATHLAEHPDTVDEDPAAAPEPAPPRSELDDLLRRPEVQRTLSFPDGATLTPELIRRCCGARPDPAA